MYPEPSEPPSGLQEELAAESERPLPSVYLRLIPWGTAVSIVGLAMTAFYTWGVPVDEPLQLRALLNAGASLIAIGLALIVLGLVRARAQRHSARNTLG
jgi:hypothetical protein